MKHHRHDDSLKDLNRYLAGFNGGLKQMGRLEDFT